MFQKRWLQLPKEDPLEVKKLCNELGIPTLLAELILRRGYKTKQEVESFLYPKLSNLRSPYEFRQMHEAVNLLRDSVVKDLRIIILGDYDVDGITATTLMLDFLRKCGCRNLDFFIPNRIKHGYGLTGSTVDILLEKEPDLVITVDNGITAFREVKRLNEAGVMTIITDHHLAEKDLLPSGIVINPNHPECEYPFKEISGCGVAFKLIMALRKSFRETGFWNNERPEPNLLNSLDLVALGTVADMVSLVDENRILTYHGLIVMNEKPRLSIKVLKRLKKVDTVISSSLSFQFAPLLNASGRLQDANIAVKFLLSEDLEEAENMANILNCANLQRREKEKKMIEKAFIQCEIQKQFPALILTSPDFHEGINGIVATRLVELFYKPVIVLTEKEEILKGSGRSIPEIHLKSALSECSDLLERFGGHASAAGCSLVKENLEEFRERFFAVCHKLIPNSSEPKLPIDGLLKLPEITNIFVDQLNRLQPFGEGNKEPIFEIDTPVLPFKVIKKKHVKWEIKGDFDILGWNLAETFLQETPSQLAVNLGFNEFRGSRKIQLTIQDSQI